MDLPPTAAHEPNAPGTADLDESLEIGDPITAVNAFGVQGLFGHGALRSQKPHSGSPGL